MTNYIKIILLFLLLILLSNCSYKPTMAKKNYNFSIEEVNLNGDEDINSVIERQLSFLNTNKEKKYSISLETSREKVSFSKDSKGDTLKYEIIILAKLKINSNGKLLLEKNLIKKNIYNNLTDKFKLERYEDIITNNLSEKIVDDVITAVTNINDN